MRENNLIIINELLRKKIKYRKAIVQKKKKHLKINEDCKNNKNVFITHGKIEWK